MSASSFRTTHWTRVLAARGDSPEAREALSALCAAYYEPVLVFLSHAAPDAPRDLAHAFFESLLQKPDPFAQVRREGGKFRAYLLGALKHFLSHAREHGARLRRGGGAELLPIESDTAMPLPDARAISPDAAFDREWAVTVLARALAALREEARARGEEARFDCLKPWLHGGIAHGAQAELARELGIEAGALKSAVHRLKTRFRQLVKEEIASTLDPAADVDEEMRALFSALAS